MKPTKKEIKKLEEKIKLLRMKSKELHQLQDEFNTIKKWQFWKLFQVMSLLNRIEEVKKYYARFGL